MAIERVAIAVAAGGNGRGRGTRREARGVREQDHRCEFVMEGATEELLRCAVDVDPAATLTGRE